MRSMSVMKDYTLTVHTGGRTLAVSAAAGQTLLSALQSAGLADRIHTPCGGRGTCRKCTVRIGDQRQEVLACLHKADRDIAVYLPEKNKARIRNGGVALRWKPAPEETDALGLAVDLGTTTVVAYLFDLRSGERLGVLGEQNAQRVYGADVVTRAQYARDGENGLVALAQTARRQIGQMAEELCRDAGRNSGEIVRYVAAGNTVMQHLLCALPTDGIVQAPFTPHSLFRAQADGTPGESVRSAAEYGWPGREGASVTLMPCLSGYVGGDITAGLLASSLYKPGAPVLFVDLGTNGEMALRTGGEIISCATAAGPAFEGANISCGMGGVNGAIDRVWVKNGKPAFSVIGGGAPKGLCGSGLVDAVAALLELELADETGYLEEDFVIAPGVALTPRDIRELQLAKAAVAAGIDVLLQTAGMTAKDIGSLYLAGGFGGYLRKESAHKIGLFPKEIPIRVVGNASGQGAAAVLRSPNARKALEGMLPRCRYLELSGHALFNDAYMEHMMFE